MTFTKPILHSQIRLIVISMFFKCLDFHMSTPYSLSKNNNLSQLHIGSACLTLLYLEIRLAQ